MFHHDSYAISFIYNSVHKFMSLHRNQSGGNQKAHEEKIGFIDINCHKQ